MTRLRPCSEAEHEDFLAVYPRTLRRITDTSALPPLALYRDVQIDRVVAVGPAEKGSGWMIAEE